MAALQNSTVEAIKNNQTQLLNEWTKRLEASGATRNLKEHDIAQQTRDLLGLLLAGLENGNGSKIAAAGWEDTRQFLEKLSQSAPCSARIPSKPPTSSSR